MPESTQSEHYDSMPNDLEPLWMPFTANKQFKSAPRMLVAAEGMHYTNSDNRQILDATSGLWCVNCGHARKEITEAVSAQVGRLEFAPGFQMGHPASFEFAARLAALAPGDLDHGVADAHALAVQHAAGDQRVVADGDEVLRLALQPRQRVVKNNPK